MKNKENPSIKQACFKRKISKDKRCIQHYISSKEKLSEAIKNGSGLLNCIIEKVPIVLSGEQYQLSLIAEKLKKEISNHLNILAHEKPESCKLIGGLNFSSLSSFPSLFEKQRIIDLTSNATISNL